MKKFRVAVIGTGFVGVAHIEALRRLGNIDIVALCDTSNAQERAKELFVEKAYTNYEKMINEQNLDFIHICTPNNTHYKIAKYAMMMNVNVVLEKPMTFNSDEAKELSNLSKKKGLICAVNFHNRLYPACAYIKEIIKEKQIGEITSINGMYVQDWLLYKTDYSWRLNSEESGKTRTIADIGSHWIDLIEYMSGLKVTSVLADFKIVHPIRKKPIGNIESFSTAKLNEYEDININTEDIVTLLFRLSNGAIGSALFSQMVAGKKNNIEVLISGTKASVEWKLENHENVVIGYRNKPSELVTKDYLMMKNLVNMFDYPSGHTEGYPDVFKQVFKQIYNNVANPAYASFYNGFQQMLISEKIYESAKKRTWIEINE